MAHGSKRAVFVLVLLILLIYSGFSLMTTTEVGVSINFYYLIFLFEGNKIIFFLQIKLSKVFML